MERQFQLWKQKLIDGKATACALGAVDESPNSNPNNRRLLLGNNGFCGAVSMLCIGFKRGSAQR
jgi:hypothetical protein